MLAAAAAHNFITHKVENDGQVIQVFCAKHLLVTHCDVNTVLHLNGGLAPTDLIVTETIVVDAIKYGGRWHLTLVNDRGLLDDLA